MYRLVPCIVTVSLLCGITAAAGRSISPGTSGQMLELQDGGVMRYAVHCPRVTGDDRLPLILALHYGGTVQPYYGRTFMNILVKPAMKDLGAIIVAPDCPGRGWKDPVSERAVLQLLDHAVKNWPVDGDRVVLTGFSMGGMGAWYLACRHPERFSAVVAVSAVPHRNELPIVPVYAIHSQSDGVIDIGPTREAIEKMRARGVDAELLELKRLTHYQTSMFVRPLKTSVEWIRQVWRTRAMEGDSPTGTEPEQ